MSHTAKRYSALTMAGHDDLSRFAFGCQNQDDEAELPLHLRGLHLDVKRTNPDIGGWLTDRPESGGHIVGQLDVVLRPNFSQAVRVEYLDDPVSETHQGSRTFSFIGLTLEVVNFTERLGLSGDDATAFIEALGEGQITNLDGNPVRFAREGDAESTSYTGKFNIANIIE